MAENFREIFPELHDRTVLNVDDNRLNQLVISKIMESAGVKTVNVNNGAEAVAKLREGLQADAIFMDLEMPVLDGYKASEYIRKNIDKNIPIIVNSGLISSFHKLKLKRLGINDFLEKPYSMKDIFSKLSKNLHAVSNSM